MTGVLLDRAEVAERLHVSEMTVRRLGRAGYLTEVRVSERAIRIDEDSVERHIAGRRIVRQPEESAAATGQQNVAPASSLTPRSGCGVTLRPPGRASRPGR